MKVSARNKNWVTVRDKCPQINVQFKWHTFFKKKIRTDGQTDERTHVQTDKRTDGRSDYIMPQILFGGIKTSNKNVIAENPLTNLYEMNSSLLTGS